jgi:hypothetical protein
VFEKHEHERGEIASELIIQLGIGNLLAVPDVLRELESGELIRLLPRWYADAGAISLYYANRTLLPARKVESRLSQKAHAARRVEANSPRGRR